MTRRPVRFVLTAVLLLLAGLLSPTFTAVPAAAAAPADWRTSVFSLVPAPGHPAYVFVARNGRVYAGTYDSGDRQRSKVFEWTADGALLRSWVVPGQRLGAPHGVQVANQTRDGKLVLLETSTRTVRTLDVRTGRFRTVATFPKDVVPNYATWGPKNLFVTDYGAGGGVWRVFRDGRVERWFTSPQLKGTLGFGTTGLVYRARQHDFLIDQSTVADGSSAPTNGHLDELGIRHGRPTRLRTLWTSEPTDLPDGFGVARSGRIYVAQAGLTEQLVELAPDGTEIGRYPSAPGTGENGSGVPFDTPSSATFLGHSVLVANQSAVQDDPSHQAILRVHVGEPGLPPHLPRSAIFR